MDGLGQVDTDIGHGVGAQGFNDRQEESDSHIVNGDFSKKLCDQQKANLPTKVHGVMSQLHELVNQARIEGPLGSEGFDEKGMASGGSLSNHENGVIKPAKAHLSKALVVPLMAQESGYGGDEADDGLTDPPLTVLGEARDGREEDVIEEVNANDLDGTLEIGYNVEAHFRVFISQELDDER